MRAFNSVLAVLPLLVLGACDSARPSPALSPAATTETPVQTPTQTPAPTPGDPAQPAQACDVLVSFTSICCGVNQPLRERIDALIAADARVASFSTHSWGREGEFDLCLVTRDPAQAAGLTRDIAAVIASDNRAPPVHVSQGGKPQVGYRPPADLPSDQRLPGT